MPVFLFFIALILSVVSVLAAQENVTLDDTDSRITYNGNGWKKTDAHRLYFRGTHAYSVRESDTASFTFTGTAIYYYSSLWGYEVSTVITFDNGTAETISLQDRSVNTTDATVDAHIVWSAARLSNGEHTLVVSKGSHVLMDGLIYTTEVIDPSSSATETSSASDSSGSGISSTSDSNSESNDSSNAGVIGGAVGGTVGGITLLAAFLFWYIRRRRMQKQALAARFAEHTAPQPYFYDRNTSSFTTISTRDGHEAYKNVPTRGHTLTGSMNGTSSSQLTSSPLVLTGRPSKRPPASSALQQRYEQPPPSYDAAV